MTKDKTKFYRVEARTFVLVKCNTEKQAFKIAQKYINDNRLMPIDYKMTKVFL